MMMKVCGGRRDLAADWLAYGGEATLRSYDARDLGGVWPQHIEMLAACPVYFETRRHFFVHGNYQPNAPLARQPARGADVGVAQEAVPGPHISGKTAIMGHTAQKTGRIFDLGHLKCIDTWCYGEGCLTALEVYTGEVWQASKDGRLRK